MSPGNPRPVAPRPRAQAGEFLAWMPGKYFIKSTNIDVLNFDCSLYFVFPLEQNNTRSGAERTGRPLAPAFLSSLLNRTDGPDHGGQFLRSQENSGSQLCVLPIPLTFSAFLLEIPAPSLISIIFQRCVPSGELRGRRVAAVTGTVFSFRCSRFSVFR